ncbi:TPA: GpE family phage tail protein [Escherichia coli]|nr:GpE family phage tail protein [Escherichia coli]
MAKFDNVEELVADIAVVFNWSPGGIFSMPLGEVMSWRERAAQRSGVRNSEIP